METNTEFVSAIYGTVLYYSRCWYNSHKKLMGYL